MSVLLKISARHGSFVPCPQTKQNHNNRVRGLSGLALCTHLSREMSTRAECTQEDIPLRRWTIRAALAKMDTADGGKGFQPPSHLP